MTPDQYRMANMLIEVANFYNEDPVKNRCINDHIPQYGPTSTSPGCAIGMYLRPDVASKIEGSPILVVMKSYLETILPKWLRNMDSFFLDDIQLLHDRNINWDEGGISLRGKEIILNIIETHNLSKNYITSRLNFSLYE